jgi:hypothetical protein
VAARPPERMEVPMSVRSLRAAVRRSPALAAAAVLSAGLVLSGCGDDVVDDGVEQEVDEEVDTEETDG